VEIREDGSLDILERIRVRAEGNQIRRGIYRDFPTRYTDRAGNRVRVGFEVVGVEKNGTPEPWFTEGLSNGTRVNTGNDDFLLVPAEYEYILRYRTTHQLGFFEDHDELYWNAIGAGWIFPIEEVTVQVRLPAAVPIEDMTVEGYTGRQGERGGDYLAEVVGPGVARYRTTRPLDPREAFTIVLTFPKGLIPEPTATDRAGRVLSDNRGVLIGLTGFLLLLAFCIREWQRIGRDPRKGVIIPRYEPRPDFPPSACRYLTRMSYDTRAFSGDILALAVAGELAIRQEKRLLKDEWALERTSNGQGTLPDAQIRLLAKLFPRGKDTLVLKNSNAKILSAARSAHGEALDRALDPRYFRTNGRSVVWATLIAFATAICAFVFSGGYGMPSIVALNFGMVVVLLVFTFLIRAPTPEGRKALDEIEGLRLYLSVAERDELAILPGPAEAPPRIDAARYEALLPYAVALEVEEAWTKKFTLAVGAAAAAAAASQMAWYRGHGPITDIGSFGKAVGSSLGSTISSASSPPGSSSGSGGGGSAGGGGGGGGGGGR
jgi:uncharacterized membrane protein YgcG